MQTEPKMLTRYIYYVIFIFPRQLARLSVYYAAKLFVLLCIHLKYVYYVYTRDHLTLRSQIRKKFKVISKRIFIHRQSFLLPFAFS